MEIGAARPEEWPELERIYRETRLARFVWLRPARISASTLKHDAEGIYVAREAGRPVGFVSVWAQDAFVHHLYVDRGRQGRGTGSALLDFASARHPGTLRLKCVEQNHAAREFYLRRGWRVIDRGRSEDGDYLLMEWTPES
jgi:GNAT superfamily N-acetyltransferase